MFEEKIRELLSKFMTERGFKLWEGINSLLPNIWNKPTSSTKKYHKRKDGSVPDISEHTFEMLNAASKIMSMFNIKSNTIECDLLLITIALHDGLKYGENGDREHTLTEHDSLIANLVEANKNSLLKLYPENLINEMIDALRFHSGRWSTMTDRNFSFNGKSPIVIFVHILDMLSSKDCLKF